MTMGSPPPPPPPPPLFFFFFFFFFFFSRLTSLYTTVWLYRCSSPFDADRIFAALADATRRDIVRRAMTAARASSSWPGTTR